MIRTRVVIVGGGPAGLVLAIELGRRGVPCVLLEEDPGPPDFPKANATTSRTMEHYRRLGFAAEIRALGLPEDYPQDITYFTRYARHELARLRGRSRREAIEARERPDSRWPTPEPLHRAQQMYIEVVLRKHAERQPAVELRLGWRGERIEARADGVTVEARQLATGALERIEADYAVGCDGARSIVRETLGIPYEGFAGEERPWMGGRMLATFFRAPALYSIVRTERSWQYWAINLERRAAACAIDGHGLFVLHVQLPQGEKGSLAYARESLALTAGVEFPHEIIGIDEWLAGYTLVAERFGNDRVFLAGDAAHLFTPTAGQGYNTSVDDASNLAWKLAAVSQGWGGSGLLASYERERQSIARRNTRFAREMADSIGRMRLPEALEEENAAGEQARAELGEQLYRHAAAEFDVPGIHFGMWYGASPIVSDLDIDPPVDDPFRYVPSSCPGARAPHVWLEDGVSIFDRFGRDFTLLRLGKGRGRDTARLEAAARARGVPFHVLDVESEEARDLYARDLVLIRPDQHVAWRGNGPPADAAALWARVTGHA